MPYGIWALEYRPQARVINGWLERYDPEAHDGLGWADFTDDPAHAMRFESATAALECWRTIPKARPLRPDGQPNRPLTGFTVEVRPLPEEVLV